MDHVQPYADATAPGRRRLPPPLVGGRGLAFNGDMTDDSVRRSPVADDGEDCICLTRTQAPLKLTGPPGRLLNPFARF